MSRHTRIYTISKQGRDFGKSFLLTEMLASQGEKWAARVWLALARSGVNIPDEFAGSGWAGLAMLSLSALRFSKFEDLEPLMDEMFHCVQFIPDKRKTDIVRPLIEEDIDEIETRLELRHQVFDLHAGPFLEGIKSTLGLVPGKGKTSEDSSSASTSPVRSKRS